MLFEEKYPDGLQMTQFFANRIEQISVFQHNYYVGFGKDLLLAVRVNDDTTEWFIALNNTFHCFGESRCSRGELLSLYWQRLPALEQPV